MSTANKHYTIVGGGLAGTTLALTFLQKGVSFQLINKHSPKAASNVAAGLYNPLSFKRCIASWQASEQLTVLEKFYPYWQNKFQQNFYHPLDSYKIVPNAEYYNTWTGKSTQKIESQFLGDITESKDAIYASQNGVTELAKVHHSGYVDVPLYLKSAHKYLNELGLIKDGRYNFLKKDSADHIIFAEGVEMCNNSYFNYIPLVPTHGDILNIKCNFEQQNLLHFGKFLIPLKNGEYRYGSTYNWDIKNSEPSKEGLQALKLYWNKHFSKEFELLEHKAGLRPATKDRMPLLGQHPEYKNLHCFNGLGSKGVLMVPFLAELMTENLLNNCEIEKQINISRYQHLWKK